MLTVLLWQSWPLVLPRTSDNCPAMFELIFSFFLILFAVVLIRMTRSYFAEKRRVLLEAEIQQDFLEEFQETEGSENLNMEAMVNWLEEQHLNDEIQRKQVS